MDDHLGQECYRRGTAVACGWGAHCGDAFCTATEALCGVLRRSHGVQRARVIPPELATRDEILRALVHAPSLDDDIIIWMLSMPRVAGGLQCAPDHDGWDVVSARDLHDAERALARRITARRGPARYHLLYIWDPTPPSDMINVHLPSMPIDADAAPRSHVGVHCVMAMACPYHLPQAVKPSPSQIAYADGPLPPPKVSLQTTAPTGKSAAPPRFAFWSALAEALEAPETFPGGAPVALVTLYRRVLERLVAQSARLGTPPPPIDATEPLGQHYGGCGHVLRLEATADPVAAAAAEADAADAEVLVAPASPWFSTKATRKRDLRRRRRIDEYIKRATVVFACPLQIRTAGLCAEVRFRRAALTAAVPLESKDLPSRPAPLHTWWRDCFGQLSWVGFTAFMPAVEHELSVSSGESDPSDATRGSGRAVLVQLHGPRRVSLLAAVEAALCSMVPPQTKFTPADFADQGLYPGGGARQKQSPAPPRRAGRLRQPGKAVKQRRVGSGQSELIARPHAAQGRVYFRRMTQLAAEYDSRHELSVCALMSALVAECTLDPLRRPETKRELRGRLATEYPPSPGNVTPPSPPESMRTDATPPSDTMHNDSFFPSATTWMPACESPAEAPISPQRGHSQLPQSSGSRSTSASTTLLQFLVQVASEAQERQKHSTETDDYVKINTGPSDQREPETDKKGWKAFELPGLRWLSMLNRHATREDPALPPPQPPTVLCLARHHLMLCLDPRSSRPRGDGLSDAERAQQPLLLYLARCGISSTTHLLSLAPAALQSLMGDWPHETRALIAWRTLRTHIVCRPLQFDAIRYGQVLADSITALLRDIEPLLQDKRYVSRHRIKETSWDAPGSGAAASMRALLHVPAGQTLVDFGVTVGQHTAGGVHVASVTEDSRASKSGVRHGMELVSVDGVPVRTVVEAKDAIFAAVLNATVEFAQGPEVASGSVSTSLTTADRHHVVWDTVLHKCGHELPSKRGQALARLVCLLRRGRMFDEPRRHSCFGWPPSVSVLNWSSVGGLWRPPSMGTFEALLLPDFPVGMWLEVRDEVRQKDGATPTSTMSTIGTRSGFASMKSMKSTKSKTMMKMTMVSKAPHSPKAAKGASTSITGILRERMPWFPWPRVIEPVAPRQREDIRRFADRRQAEFLERHADFEKRVLDRLLRIIALRDPYRFPRVENITEEEKQMKREAELKVKAEEQLLLSWDITPDDIRDTVREYLLGRVKEADDIRDVRPLPASVAALSYARGAVTIAHPGVPAEMRWAPRKAHISVTVVGGYCHVAMHATYANPLPRRARPDAPLRLSVPQPLQRRLLRVRVEGGGHSQDTFVAPFGSAGTQMEHNARFSPAAVDIPLVGVAGGDTVHAHLEWTEALRWVPGLHSFHLALPTVMQLMLYELEPDVASVELRRSLELSVRVAANTGVYDVVSPTHPIAPDQADVPGLGMISYSPIDGPHWANRPMLVFVRYPARPWVARFPLPVPTVSAVAEAVDGPRAAPLARAMTSPAAQRGFTFARIGSPTSVTDVAEALAASEPDQERRWLCHVLLVPPAAQPLQPPAAFVRTQEMLIVLDTSAAMAAEPIYHPPLAAVRAALKSTMDNNAFTHVGSVRIVATACPPTQQERRERPWAEWRAAAPITEDAVEEAKLWLNELVPAGRLQYSGNMWDELLDGFSGSVILLTATPPSEQLCNALRRRRHHLSFSCLSVGPQANGLRYSALVHSIGGQCKETYALGQQLQQDAEGLLLAAVLPPLLTDVTVVPPSGWRVVWQSFASAPALPQRFPLAMLCELEGPEPPASVEVCARSSDGSIFSETVPVAVARPGALPARGTLRHLTQSIRDPSVARLLCTSETGDIAASSMDYHEWCLRVRPSDPRQGLTEQAAARVKEELVKVLALPCECLRFTERRAAAEDGELAFCVRPVALSGHDRERCAELLRRRPELLQGWHIVIDVPLQPVASPATLPQLRDELCEAQILCHPITELLLAQGPLTAAPPAPFGVVRAPAVFGHAARRSAPPADPRSPPRAGAQPPLPAVRVRAAFQAAPASHRTSATAHDDMRRMQNGDGACWHEFGWDPGAPGALQSLLAPRMAELATAGREPRTPKGRQAATTLRMTFQEATVSYTGRRLVAVGEEGHPNSEELRRAAALAADVPAAEVTVDYPPALYSRSVAITFSAPYAAAARALATTLKHKPDAYIGIGMPRVAGVAAVRNPELLLPEVSPGKAVSSSISRGRWDDRRLAASWPITKRQDYAAAAICRASLPRLVPKQEEKEEPDGAGP